MRACSKCKEVLPVTSFYSSRPTVCKECHCAAVRVGNCKDPERRRLVFRRSHLMKFYKLTLEQYQELSKNGCAVCGTFEDLCVDHDHDCCPGQFSCGSCVRGVLCGRHNKAAGFLRENADDAQALADYLRGRVKV